jgi:hypothetical protein
MWMHLTDISAFGGLVKEGEAFGLERIRLNVTYITRVQNSDL